MNGSRHGYEEESKKVELDMLWTCFDTVILGIVDGLWRLVNGLCILLRVLWDLRELLNIYQRVSVPLQC